MKAFGWELIFLDFRGSTDLLVALELVPMVIGTYRKSGFSLIELLVGISIMALLIALLLPALARVRGAVQRTQCAVNLRSIGQGVAAYMADFKNWPPPGYTIVQPGAVCPTQLPRNTAVTTDYDLPNYLVGLKYVPGPYNDDLTASTLSPTHPFYRKNSPFLCPEAQSLSTFSLATPSRIPGHYGFNWTGGTVAVTTTRTTVAAPGWSLIGRFQGPTRLDQIASPDGHLFAGDAFQISESYALQYTNMRLGTIGASSTQVNATDTYRHHGDTQVMFLDGAVSGIPQAFRDIRLLPSGTSTSISLAAGSAAGYADVERAARYFHPNPPANWAY